MRILLFIILMIIDIPNLLGQDSLVTDKGVLLTYDFDIRGGKLFGEGGDFLREEMAKAQFTLLGEYHGSARISEFTNAIIPILDSIQYKTILLEVGRYAGKYIDEIPGEPVKALGQLYNKYQFSDGYGDTYLPMPFFENQEDLAFLKSYKSRNWKTIGVDQEFYDGMVMLFDMLYDNLSMAEQNTIKSLHEEVIDSLTFYYTDDYDNDNSIMSKIQSSPIISKYLSAVNTGPDNSGIIHSILQSAEIYESDWYTNYNLRVQHMKSNLRDQLEEADFDISQDKLLAKMGALHLSKGFSLWGAYEIGNTLNELASYHGNSALNIIFLSRYYEEGGEVKDLIDSDKVWDSRLNDLRQLGKIDEWVIIDLRPSIKRYVSQSSDYTFNKYVEEYMKTYDLVIIPKLETIPTPFTR